MNKTKKVLVVGAGGFIGGHLVKKILNNGNSVVATDIKPKEYCFKILILLKIIMLQI